MLMHISGIIPQLQTTDLAASIEFYTTKLGCALQFQYEDFYAGISAGSQSFHLKQVDEKDPSIDYVEDHGHFHLYLETLDVRAAAELLGRNGVRLERGVQETEWNTIEFVIKDDQGHTIYFGQQKPNA
jgi:catechol 2,3-dioxygenase-like lactoylglutathione lyase family enzyme